MQVIWYEAMRGSWDHGLLCEIFDSYPDTFNQHNTKELLVFDKAIIMVVGKTDVKKLNDYLNKFKSGIVILMSEEDAYFDWKSAIPEHFEIWTQYYHPSTKNDPRITNRLLLGPPNRIKDYKINKHLPKKYLWSFVGQVQNKFREECVKVLRTLTDGFLQEVEMFGGNGKNGMDYQEYLDIMCQSKFVICPAGSMTADSFRVYEAMECGAIPITDVRSPRDSNSFDYWHSVYPRNSLVTIYDWNSLPWLLDKGRLDTSIVINDWWHRYKNDIKQKLIDEANKN